jgi:hypothetical protein
MTTDVVSSNPVHAEVYSILHYVINFVSDLPQVGGFLRFPLVGEYVNFHGNRPYK